MVKTYESATQLDIPYNILCPVYFLRYPNQLATHVISVDVLSREIVTRARQEQQGNSGGIFASGAAEEDAINVLKTTRLILKRGTLPRWAPKGLIRNAESWVLEESEVELDAHASSSAPAAAAAAAAAAVPGRTMRSWTRNLDHTTVLAVTEQNVFSERLAGASTLLPHHQEQHSAEAADKTQEKKRRDGAGTSGSALHSNFYVESGIGFALLRSRIEKFGLNRVVTHVDSSRQGLLSTYTRFLQERGLNTSADVRGAVVVLPPGASKRQRLAAALRPPFLDGDFVGPFARFRQRFVGVRTWWRGLMRGGTGDEDRLGVRMRSNGEAGIAVPSRRNPDADAHATHDGRRNGKDGGKDSDDERSLTPMELLRKRFLNLRDNNRDSDGA